jgi:GNAT superfamily N-acetyltransferase
VFTSPALAVCLRWRVAAGRGIFLTPQYLRSPAKDTRMQPPQKIDSIASSATSIAGIAAGHLDLTWRKLMCRQGAFADEHCFRLMSGEPHPLGNLAIFSHGASRQVTERGVAPLLELEVPTAALFTGEPGDEVVQALSALGFVKAEDMPAMAVDIDGIAPTSLPAGYSMTRIDAGPVASDWTDVMAAGFELPRGLARMLSPEVLGADMAVDADTQFFGIWNQGRLVATSMMFLAGGVAGIYCVATLPGERGRGLGAHATAEPLRVAHGLGYGVGVLQSSESGHRVYRRLGFIDVGTLPLFVRMPA